MTNLGADGTLRAMGTATASVHASTRPVRVNQAACHFAADG